MSATKIFTLAEANALLPELRKMLSNANRDIIDKAETIAHAFAMQDSCEQEMSKVKVSRNNSESSISTLRECRLNFQASIESLEQAKKSYIQTLNFWLDEISQKGAIVRDIKSGLLDFPADSGNFQYYLCWQSNEDCIQYWHPTNDGFIGRRPLTRLSEYL
jgi:hypothetical protein